MLRLIESAINSQRSVEIIKKRILFRDYEKGFTLIELIIVVFIMGMITVAVIPSLITVKKQSDLERTAKMVIAELTLAQQTAVAGGNTCRVEFFLNIEAFRLYLPVDSRMVRLPDGIRISSNNFPLTDNNAYRLLSFNRNGAPNQAGTIGLSDREGNKLYIILNLATGRMRIAENPPSS